jgi:magnesium and cobalt exporter, CNNM family
MTGPFLEVLILLVLILANGVFAMSEIAIISARKARLQQQAEDGDLRARAALALAEDPNQFLSTTQIGITLVGIFAGAFGGATLSQKLAGWLSRNPTLEPYSSGLALGIVVLGITYLSLVIGELVPKRIGLTNPERIAAAVAGPMRLLSVLASPVVRLLSFSTDGLLRLLGIRPSTEPPVTEEEIRVLINQGTQAGVFEEAEQDLVESVFRLADQRISVLMTPRQDVEWLDVEDPPAETRRKVIDSVRSWFPVGHGTLDNIVGVVHAKSLLSECLAEEPLDLRALARPALFVPEGTRALKVLERFKESGTQIALVIDEYGGFEGLVTLTDILEAIVGDIPSQGEQGEPAIVRRDDGSWLLDGTLSLDDVKDLLRIRRLPGEDEGVYHTLGGFIMTQLGHIPSATDHFEWDGLRFEVMDMDGRRVDKVLVMPAAEG